MPDPIAYTAEGQPLSEEELPKHIEAGTAAFDKTRMYSMVDATGTQHFLVPGSDVWTQLGNNARLVPEAEAQHRRDIRAREESTGAAVGSALHGTASALTLGANDLLGEAVSPDYKRTVAELQEAHPGAHALGELAGYALPIAGELGLGGKVVKGVTAPLRGVSSVARGAGEAVTSGMAPGATRAVVRGATSGAVEGLGMGVQQSVSDYAIHDEPVTADRLLFNTAAGAALGGLLGGVGHIVKPEGTIPKVATKERPALTAATPAAVPLEDVVPARPGLVERGKNFLGEIEANQAFKAAGLHGSDLSRFAEREGREGLERLANRIVEDHPLAPIGPMDGIPQVAERMGERAKLAGQRVERAIGAADIEGVRVDAPAALTSAIDTLKPHLESVLPATRKKAEAVYRDFLAGLDEAIDNGVTKFEAEVKATAHKLAQNEERQLRRALSKSKIPLDQREGLIAAEMETFKPQAQMAAQQRAIEARGGVAPERIAEVTPSYLWKLRREVDAHARVSKAKPLQQRTLKDNMVIGVRDALDRHLREEIERKGTPALAREYSAAKLEYKDYALLKQLTNKRMGSEAGKRFWSLSDNIHAAAGGIAGGMIAGPAGALGALAAAGANKILRSPQASRAVAKSLHKLRGANLAIEASQASGEAAQSVAKAVAHREVKLVTGKKVPSYQIAVATTKGTATLLQLIQHLAQQNSEAQLSGELAQLDQHPGLQQELALAQSAALQYLKESIPHADQPFNPALGDNQPPPPEGLAHEWADIIRMLDRPSRFLDKLEDGSLNRQHVEVLNRILPHKSQELQQAAVAALGMQVAEGRAPNYQRRLQLGILLGQPVDSTDTPEFTQTVQNFYQSTRAHVQPKTAARHRPSTSRLAERRMNTSERIENT